jgi:iron complex outermembrane receptor protein
LTNTNRLQIQEWNNEFRLQSPREGDERFNWITGFAFNHLDRSYRYELQALSGNPLLPPNIYQYVNSDLTGNNYGVFGQGGYRLFDKRVGLSAGLRYDKTTRDLNRLPGALGFPGQRSEMEDSIWLPKATVDLRLTDNEFVYFTAGRGWTTGGVHPSAATPALSVYKKQTSWTYEAGFKTRRSDGKLSANVAFFHSAVRDFQDYVSLGTLVDYLGNASKVAIRGFETEINVLPVKRLEVLASFGTVNAKYKDYVYDAVSGFRFDGLRIRQIPDYDYSLVLQHRSPRGMFMRAEALGTGRFKEYDFDFEALRLQHFTYGGYTVFNVRAGYEGRRWRGNLFVENLADRQYFTNTSTGVGSFVGYNLPAGIVGARRVIGAQAIFKF